MYLGKMLIYNKETGKILNGCLKERFDSGLTKEMIKELRPNEAGVLNLPHDYNGNNFKEALEYHIDVSKNKETTDLKDLIVITKYREHIETEEDKLKKELLKTQAEVVDLKYKEVLNNKNLNK
ncbi:hypothetical protein K144316041_20280 [Clostridium tetani]|uniref:hypothetical protein n=1 Tax=Clostridium tetani TaxID=1513 RepID=UPI002954DB8D|nr:hypothetical protein [Clostridium tetani]BDR73320.1 hypothetical protein K144316041_20280 [Clostridium tetani]